MNDCVFCRIAAGEAAAERVLEDERTLAFLDIHPAGEGHTLVIPKTHAETVWDVGAADWEAVWRTVRRVAAGLRAAFDPDGLYVRQANGHLGGQEVMHLHAHLIPRYAAGRAPGLGGLAPVAERLRAALDAAG
ncbi:MAG: HIT family protein [Actinomycetota bacterium]|nr:MAG: HIT family protein [Actinomycetota bacterium]